jgi:hypothetical protein
MVIEGANVPIAYGFAAYDMRIFTRDSVITPVFTPDAAQSNTMPTNGVTLQLPENEGLGLGETPYQ